MLSVLFKGLFNVICPQQYRLPIKFVWRQWTRQIEPEIFWIETLVPKGKRGIDIGANEGIYSYALSKVCRVVEAFEPLESCTHALSAYSQHYRKTINLHSVALSSSKGSLKLFIPIVNRKPIYSRASLQKTGENNHCIQIPVHTLDDYQFQEVAFIKIDVEGYESEVLKGCYHTIQANRPILLIEIEQWRLKDISIGSVFKRLEYIGYEGFFLQRSTWCPVEQFSYEIHQKPFLKDVTYKAGSSVLRNKRYINNFMFLPRESQDLKQLLLKRSK